MRHASTCCFRAAAFLAVVGLGSTAGWGMTEPREDWLQHIRLGGNAAVRFMGGQTRAALERNNGFMVYQADLVFDAAIRDNLSFLYDLNVLREGTQRPAGSPTALQLNQVYLRWDRILDQAWLNAKVGRSFTPYGEEYLRWDAVDNPLASWSVSIPWGLDEGVTLFGDVLKDGKLSYALGVQNGGARFNYDDNKQKTIAARLTTEALPWLHAGLSYLNIGRQGDNPTLSTGTTELWLSGFHISPMGTTSAPGGASPSRISGGQAGEGDVEVHGDRGHVLATYGYVSITDGGGTRYNRIIRYYTAEGLGNIPGTGKKAYLAARYSAIGTFHGTRGYRFAGTESAVAAFGNNSAPYSYNFDQRDLKRISWGAGYKFDDATVLKAEYTREGTRLIDPAKTAANVSTLNRRDYFVLELAVRF